MHVMQYLCTGLLRLAKPVLFELVYDCVHLKLRTKIVLVFP